MAAPIFTLEADFETEAVVLLCACFTIESGSCIPIMDTEIQLGAWLRMETFSNQLYLKFQPKLLAYNSIVDPNFK